MYTAILFEVETRDRYLEVTTSTNESPHLYEESQFKIWLLYGNIIDTDVYANFSSMF